MGILTKKEGRRFIELLARSNFSFLKGASHPEDYILQSLKVGMPAVGLCDIDGFYGAGRAFQESERSHQRFFIGATLTLTDSSPVALVPMNKVGYGQLCRLITLGKRRAPKGQSALCLQDLLAPDIQCLAFALPPFEQHHLEQLQHAFLDRLYLGLYRHQNWISERQTQHGLKLSKKLGIEAIATNLPLMHHPSQKRVLDLVTCIAKGLKIQEAGRELSLNSEAFLKSHDEMLKLWPDHPELVYRTYDVAQRIKFSFKELRYRYPQEALPEGETDSKAYFEKIVWESALKKYKGRIPAKVRGQITQELNLIFELEFEDYFLTIWDIIHFAQEQNILFQGRGSAANSVICYVLGITAIDPVQMDLLFERFISRERGDPPDIDVDFEHERREEVIQYIYRKYGDAHAAMVCEVICFRSRMALRETAKIFGLDHQTIGKMIKWMGREGLSRLTTLEGQTQLSSWGISPTLFQQILDGALRLKGFPRHLGIHTGGFVLSHDPLIETVPVEKATMEGRYVVQWNKDDLEALGLMKIDVLALGMLTCLKKCLTLLKNHKGKDFELSTIPLEDQKTFEMVQRSDTVGVFQIESRAQMSMLPRIKPKCFYDYVVEVAIVRPGPLQGGMVHPYIRRRQGLEQPTYAHPALEPVLKKTLGVPIFQEQVMKMAVVVAGFTPGESDELRRVMSSAWRKGERMNILKERLLYGMLQFGLTHEYAEKIYKTIEGFGSYGFPESHAASFALLTAVSCYIKCHYPDVFACALLNSQPMGFYSPRSLLADAQRHGVKILPPDVNLSLYDYNLIEDSCLRVGLRALYGVPKKDLESLIAHRQRYGYSSIEDFIIRSGVSRPTLLRLAAAGAFGTFRANPRDALWEVLKSPKLKGHAHDFELLADHGEAQTQKFSKMNPWEQVQNDYQALGFSIDWHPMKALRPTLKASKLHTSKDIFFLKHGSTVQVGGLVTVRQKPPTARGTMFMTLEDEFGFINVIVPASVYEAHLPMAVTEPLLQVNGHLEFRSGVRNVHAVNILPLKIQRMNDAERDLMDRSRDFS
ncbi:MAG: error-prone DNA polymerase [Oligoflexia bacterium]|nr:error-prone DNA polymerase [Oligoflexia bacterium]